MRLPRTIEQHYFEAIRDRIIAGWKDTTQRILISRLPAIEREVAVERPGGIRIDEWVENVSSLMHNLTNAYDETSKQSGDIAKMVFEETDRLSHRQWYEVAKKVFGVDLVTFEPWIANEAMAFINENVDLITKTEAEVVSDISRIVNGGFRAGKRWETLQDEIMTGTDLTKGVFNKIETRAELIARDQTLKLYSDLGEKRQQNAGLVWYVWRSAEDERVVGNPTGKYPDPTSGHGDHYFMNGKICQWKDASVYADSIEDAKDGKWKNRPDNASGAKPGYQFQCRCYAEPVFDTLLA